jgi:glycosyltransferase involved in cell wall biosynthesis
VKILHVVPSYLPAWRYGGPIRSVHGLARAQAAAGDEVEVFTTDADGPLRLAVPTGRAVDVDGVAVTYFRLGFGRRSFRAPAMAPALARRAPGFDVVHLHSVFLWPTWRAARSARRAGTPYVVSPRGILDPELVRQRGRWRKRFWIAAIERRTLADASAIHVTSELEAAGVRALGLGLAPLVVVPNGVDLALDGATTGDGALDRAAAAAAGGPYWLALGRLAAKKRLDLLVAATALVPGLRLVVAGNDDEGLAPALRAQAVRLGIAGRVELVGEVRGEAKRRLLAGAVALALPSASENFGNVVLESLAAGRPAIVSPAVGAAEVVRAAGAGAVVEATPAALAEAARRLLDDPSEAARQGERGRKHVEGHLGWERIAASMRELYVETAKARQS